jgi:hypothetical protein
MLPELLCARWRGQPTTYEPWRCALLASFFWRAGNYYTSALLRLIFKFVTLAASKTLARRRGGVRVPLTQPLRPSPAGRVGPGGAGGVRGTLRRN